MSSANDARVVGTHTVASTVDPLHVSAANTTIASNNHNNLTGGRGT